MKTNFRSINLIKLFKYITIRNRKNSFKKFIEQGEIKRKEKKVFLTFFHYYYKWCNHLVSNYVNVYNTVLSTLCHKIIRYLYYIIFIS